MQFINKFNKKHKGKKLNINSLTKLGKEYIKAIHCQPAYLTYMQSTS